MEFQASFTMLQLFCRPQFSTLILFITPLQFHPSCHILSNTSPVPPPKFPLPRLHNSLNPLAPSPHPPVRGGTATALLCRTGRYQLPDGLGPLATDSLHRATIIGLGTSLPQSADVCAAAAADNDQTRGTRHRLSDVCRGVIMRHARDMGHRNGRWWGVR